MNHPDAALLISKLLFLATSAELTDAVVCRRHHPVIATAAPKVAGPIGHQKPFNYSRSNLGSRSG